MHGSNNMGTQRLRAASWETMHHEHDVHEEHDIAGLHWCALPCCRPAGPSKGSSPLLTVLYSHGNAVDLGQMLPVLREFSRIFGCNVM